MYRQRKNNKFSRGRNFHKRGGSKRRSPANSKVFDPRSVVGKFTKAVKDEYVTKNTFADFNLDSQLTKNINSRKFTAPTPIQDQAIPEIMKGNDVVGIANTGTGKTAAFLIPLINKVGLNPQSRVLIVAPTRELVLQIEKELQVYAWGMPVRSAICIGGVSIKRQFQMLDRRPGFVVGTPGRLLDLENRQKLKFNDFDSIVLDEVDRMLDMGFIHDVKKIIAKLPVNRQSLFFSATIDKKVTEILSQFVSDPISLSVGTNDITENIHQEVIELKGRNKEDVLRKLLETKEVEKTLVFTRTKSGADRLHRSLSTSGFKTAVMHGNRTQSQRQKSLDLFRKGKVNILIATDVASRGIDVADITHVINHDLPGSYDDYIHRIGRTGRAN
ncbi:DEAD/DEAH box helicase, partial [candidate division WWE3 bacterium]|nr:DEAD/DEAH box helicase [candidate division WWE3 bacterium]